ncbi:MAG: hypothetical protein KJO50_10685, partial [Bacteroidia bacterium]|nr:hypothetical protein [Bacteroidia bacterium]
YANWEEKGVYLQTQKMPENNYLKDSMQSVLRFKEKKIKSVKKELQSQIHKLSLEGKDVQLHLKAYKRLSEEEKILAEKLGTVVP